MRQMLVIVVLLSSGALVLVGCYLWIGRSESRRRRASEEVVGSWSDEEWQRLRNLVLAVIYDSLHRQSTRYMTRRQLLDGLGRVDGAPALNMISLDAIASSLETTKNIRFGRSSDGTVLPQRIYLTGQGIKTVETLLRAFDSEGATATMINAENYINVTADNSQVALNSPGAVLTHITHNDAEMVRAVEMLLVRVADAVDDGQLRENRDDVIEVAESLREESAQPNPFRARLRSLLIGLKHVVGPVGTSALAAELTTEINRILHL